MIDNKDKNKNPINLTAEEQDKLLLNLNAKSVDLKNKRLYKTKGLPPINANDIPDGSIIADKLTENVLGWITSIVFSATDFDTVAWTSGTLTFANGDSYSINSGNTGNMTLLTYIYFNSDVDNNDLLITTTFSNVVGENITLLAVAKPATASNQSAFFVPAVGVFGINETVIGPNSISTGKIQASAITTNELAANSVTAAKISVASLSAISADLGTITAGTVTGATIQTATSGARVVIDSTNGIRVFGSSSLYFQAPVDGGHIVRFADFKSLNTVFGISNSDGNGQLNYSTIVGWIFNAAGASVMTAGASGITIASGVPITMTSANINFTSGFGIASGTTSFEVNSSYARAYHGGTTVLEVSTSGTKVYIGGTLRTILVDTADLGTGTKNYLYY